MSNSKIVSSLVARSKVSTKEVAAVKIDITVAAVAIKAVAALSKYQKSPEPYREAAYALGWESLDGTPWWSKVMDFIG